MCCRCHPLSPASAPFLVWRLTVHRSTSPVHQQQGTTWRRLAVVIVVIVGRIKVTNRKELSRRVALQLDSHSAAKYLRADHLYFHGWRMGFFRGRGVFITLSCAGARHRVRKGADRRQDCPETISSTYPFSSCVDLPVIELPTSRIHSGQPTECSVAFRTLLSSVPPSVSVLSLKLAT